MLVTIDQQQWPAMNSFNAALSYQDNKTLVCEKVCFNSAC